MAIFRKVHTSIWGDSFFSELDKDKKLFYLYILTNERTKQCGVYEITKKQIAFDLGYNIDRVSILLDYFIKEKKIRYNSETFELAVGNWLKYNSSTSPKVITCINKEFANVKDTVLIEYVKGIYTESQEEQEQEQEQEQEEKAKVFNFKTSLLELEIEEQIVIDWLKVRKDKKASNTETAFKAIIKEIEKSELSANDCIKKSVEKSWAGFNSVWLNDNKNTKEEHPAILREGKIYEQF